MPNLKSKLKDIIKVITGQNNCDESSIKIKKIRIEDIQTHRQFEQLFPINFDILESIKTNIKEHGYNQNFPLIIVTRQWIFPNPTIS